MLTDRRLSMADITMELENKPIKPNIKQW